MNENADEGARANILGQGFQFFWRGSGAKHFLWLLGISCAATLIGINMFGANTQLGQFLGWLLAGELIVVIIFFVFYAFYNPGFFYGSKTFLALSRMTEGEKRTGLVEIGEEITSTTPLVPGQKATSGIDNATGRRRLTE